MRINLKLACSVAVAALVSNGVMAQEKIRIGMVLPDLSNQIIADIDAGARARAEELGNVEVLTSATYSGEEQAQGVENYVVQQVDAIIYDSIDAAAVGPAIAKANEAGIPVVAILAGATGAKNDSYIAPNFNENGRIIGRWMAAQLGPEGVVAHVEGNPADVSGADLTRGYSEGLAEGGINALVASAPSNWERERALAVASDILTANPNLQGLYGANDDVAMGALQALNASGRADQVLLAGHNGTCEALASMLEGGLDFTVMLFNRPAGALAVDTAIALIKGEAVEENIAAPVFGIDAATAQAIAAGQDADVPEALKPEVTERVMAAKNGCST